MPKSSTSQRPRLAAALALTLGLTLAACGNGSDSAQGGKEPQTITFTYAAANSGEDAYDKLAKGYEAAHPGVTIKVNKVALNAANQTLGTQMQAGNGPDVLWVNAGSGQTASVQQLAKAGLLLELTDPSIKTTVPEAEMEGYDYQGKTYGVPSSTMVSGIIWNDELAQQGGVTLTPQSTVEDVLAQCGKVAATGKSMFGLAGSIPENNGILAMEIATSIVYGPTPDWNEKRSKGEVTFAKSAGWKQTLETIKKIYDAGCFQKGAAGAGFDALTNGAAQGNLFGFFAPSGAAKDIMDAAGGHVKLLALPFPAPQGVDPYMLVSADLGLAGNAKTKSPDLVRDFIKYTISPEGAKAFADAQGSIPIGATDTSQLLPQYAEVADILKNQKIRPIATDGWPNGQVYNALGAGITGLITGQKSVDDVLADMDSAWG